MSNQNKCILVLSELNTPLGRLVKKFSINPAGFVNDWIINEANLYVADPANYSEEIAILDNFIEIDDGIVPHYKLLKIELNYFRGTRKSQTLDLSNKINIVYGANSTGKTTLAEAIEWLFTGQLARYNANSTGQTQELKDCIKHAKTPDDEKTYVILNIQVGDNEYSLKRVLENDYDGKKNSQCSSKLYQNDIEIQQNNSILAQIILEQPPVLMQHSIGDFIRKEQDERASYFETLFNIKELSDLIEKATISDNILSGLPNTQTNNRYFNVIKTINGSAIQTLLNAKVFSDITLENVRNTIIEDLKKLLLFASIETENKNWYDILEEIKGIYEKSVLQKLPSENTIAPQKDIRLVTEMGTDNFSEIKKKQSEIKVLTEEYEEIKENLKSIDEKSKVIYNILKNLKEKQIISVDVETQDCPLCLSAKTLTKTRIGAIEQTAPIQETLKQIIDNRNTIFETICGQLSQFQQELRSLLPQSDDTAKNTEQASEDLKINEHIKVINPLLENCWADLKVLVKSIKTIDAKIKSQQKTFDESIISEILKIVAQIPEQIQKTYKSIKDYHNKFKDLKEYLENGATSGAELQSAKTLIELFDNEDDVLTDIKWHFAKTKISTLLMQIRSNHLIPFRQKIFESKEVVLNEGIKKIWSIFRNDENLHTSYGCIKLPLPSGKGLKSKIEVYANVKDKDDTKEVHALSVFTESQINLLGMAAFLTKCDIEQQTVYVMDDPLQSMDENALENFAKAFIEHILSENKQLIISTHSQNASDWIKLEHQFNTNITEYECSCGRHNGVIYKLSDNYITNVLQKIEELIVDGENDKLRSACSKMRGDILEPLYKQIWYKRLNKPIKSTKKATLGEMFNNGVGDYLSKNVSQNIIDKLKELTEFCNSSCDAHDGTDRTQEHVQRKFNDLNTIVNEIKSGLIP